MSSGIASRFVRRARHLFAFLLWTADPSAASGGAPWTPIGPWGGPVADLALDDTAAGVAYAATVEAGIFRTRDGGATWASLTSAATRFGSDLVVVCGGVVWMHSDGLYRWTGAAWVHDRAGLGRRPTIVRPVVCGERGALYAIKDEVLYRRDPAATRWLRLRGGLRTLAVDPGDRRRVFAVARTRLLRSDDAGATFHALAPLRDVLRLAVAPGGRTLFAATAAGLSRSRDGGRTWFPVAALGSDWLDGVAVRPDLPRVVYAGGPTIGLRRSVDGGATWSVDLAPGTPIQDLELDPHEPGTLWVGLGGRRFDGVLRSRDGGRTWQPLVHGIQTQRVVALAVDPFDAGRRFARAVGTACGAARAASGRRRRRRDVTTRWGRCSTTRAGASSQGSGRGCGEAWTPASSGRRFCRGRTSEPSPATQPVGAASGRARSRACCAATTAAIAGGRCSP